ncbi:hypothetical protein NW754_005279 [Fusarium falciforme]|nr:hypothetical protein NW754_005279 [Fusarium falciforme]KAJ4207409.1 hypothetical protein NW767_002661 [Fusarium falciforme]KAJ4244972.1 hypothetical protein NW757_010355 [Fusarium falciforme]
MSVGISINSSNFPLSPIHSSVGRKAGFPPTSIKLPPLTNDVKLLGSGLRTPPSDEMSTVFQPQLASYDSHAMHNYPAAVPQAARVTAAMNETRGSQYYRYPSAQPQQPQQQPQTHHGHYSYQQQQATHPQHELHPVPHASQSRNGSVSSATQSICSSRQTLRPLSPSSTSTMTRSKDESESLVSHSLQIPKCISPAGGNLSDFAAQMTCLFWFESIEELKQAETVRARGPNAIISRLPTLAKPYDQFRKWVYNVLSTTQVTQNVILLALLFIYRLKMSTPQIKGRAGSEYRLLTVALMLGNKFLDDNTYTNKTWAEVSCFAVQEIHVMEVEFLSNMRYNLVATEDQWKEWLDKLACFHEYYERATRLPASPILIPSPTNKAYHSPIPSPTAMQPAVNLPVTPTVTTSNFSPSSSHSANWNAYHSNAVSPLATKPNLQFPVSRKRSPEGEVMGHPAKRAAAPQRVPAPVMAPVNPRSNGIMEPSRLPVPHLTVITEQPQPTSAPFTGGNVGVNGYPQAAQQVAATPSVHVSLPPLQTGVRAMSTVYPPAPAAMVQQPPLPTTTAVTLSQGGFPSHAPANFGTPARHASPGRLVPFTSSPVPDQYSQASTVHTPIAHTPISNSPSVYLQQRPSPYKPVRHVNTLLYPPPSASLEQYHLSVPVPPNQMHYQPLGRRNDLRTGIVPEFLVYNRGQPQHQALPHHGLPQGHYPS